MMMVKFAQGNPYVLQESEQSNHQKAQRPDKQDSCSGFMAITEKGNHKTNQQQHCDPDSADHRHLQGLVQQDFAAFQTGDVGLKPHPRSVVIGDLIEVPGRLSLPSD